MAIRQKARLHVLHVIDSDAVSSLADQRGESFDSASRTAVEGARKALDQ